MPFSLQLPKALSDRKWKVKIFDQERAEEPHTTLVNKELWRMGLRTGTFLDPKPDPKDVPPELVVFVREHLPDLRAAWDQMYPLNPVSSTKPPATKS